MTKSVLTKVQNSAMVNFVRLCRKHLTMRCAIASRAGQVLANGHFLIQKDENGELRLNFQTDGGRLIQGGIIDSDGNLTSASKVLYRQFFELWGVSDLTLVAQPTR